MLLTLFLKLIAIFCDSPIHSHTWLVLCSPLLVCVHVRTYTLLGFGRMYSRHLSKIIWAHIFDIELRFCVSVLLLASRRGDSINAYFGKILNISCWCVCAIWTMIIEHFIDEIFVDGASEPIIWNQFEMFHLAERKNKIIGILRELSSIKFVKDSSEWNVERKRWIEWTKWKK